MAGDSAKIAAATARWSLTRLDPVAETVTSLVFKTVGGPRSPAVLKILKPYGADEINGATLMVWYGGHGAAEIFDIHDGMILMEWLDGAPLGDLSRAGRDDAASEILCDVIRLLHQRRDGRLPPLETLHERFQTLLRTDMDLWPAGHRADVARACDLARDMLATTGAVVPLHGDFHHDNVVGSPRGYLAIDAKGLIGDPAYEVANVFQNPFGAGELAADPARIDALADLFAARLGVDRKRVLAWAAAHAAISACWNRNDGNHADFNLAMLSRLLAAVDRG